MRKSGNRTGALQRDPSDLLTGRVLAAVLAATVILGLAPLPAQAQQEDTQHKPDKDSKRDILVTGQRPVSDCGGQSTAQPIDYACLNGELKTAAQAGQPTPSVADAITSQANTPSRVGTFSHAATAQRMGQNFGKSAQPYRPPAPVYAKPAAGRQSR